MWSEEEEREAIEFARRIRQENELDDPTPEQLKRIAQLLRRLFAARPSEMGPTSSESQDRTKPA